MSRLRAVVSSGDGQPVAKISRKSRDSCQVHPEAWYAIMGPLVFSYEHKSLLFALEIGLHEGVRERRCRLPYVECSVPGNTTCSF
jgi:hypothetical protein